MIVSIDNNEAREVLESVKVIFGDGRERHVTITSEGIIIDLVEAGEVVETVSLEHQDLLASPEDWEV